LSREGASLGVIGEQDHIVTRLTCDHVVVAVILAHLGRALPAEGVGLLSAVKSGSDLFGERFYAGRNIESSHMRYTMDPADVRISLIAMKRRGETVAAVVHSHPRTPPVPSKTDLVDATMPGIVHVIVGFQPAISIRAWWLDFDQHGVAAVAREVEFRSGIANGRVVKRESFAVGLGAFEQRGDDGRGRREFA